MSCDNRRKHFLSAITAPANASVACGAGSATATANLVAFLGGDSKSASLLLEQVYQRATVVLSPSPSPVATSVSPEPATGDGNFTSNSPNRDKADCTALFLEFKKQGVELPTHKHLTPGEVVPLPERETLAKYAELWRTIKAARGGQPLPQLAQALTARLARTQPRCDKCARFVPTDTAATAAKAAIPPVCTWCQAKPLVQFQPASNSPILGQANHQFQAPVEDYYAAFQRGSRSDSEGGEDTGEDLGVGFSSSPLNRVPPRPRVDRRYDKDGFDKAGYDRKGYNREGYNRQGFNYKGFNAQGLDREGYNREGFNQAGYNRQGFNSEGLDPDGYRANGLDEMGYNREGYNQYGYDRDGLDANGYRQGGLDAAGLDRYGYDATGLNPSGYTHSGYRPATRPYIYSTGVRFPDGKVLLDPTASTTNRGERVAYQAAYLPTYDKDGYDQHGFDARGYDRTGYNMYGARQPGAEAGNGQTIHPFFTPDEKGYYGDGLDKYGCNPKGLDKAGRKRAALSKRKNLPLENTLTYRWLYSEARATGDPQAVVEGVYLRCPHCGQFTGAAAHWCPHFQPNGDATTPVTTYRSGLAGTSRTVQVYGCTLPDVPYYYEVGDTTGNRYPDALNPSPHSRPLTPYYEKRQPYTYGGYNYHNFDCEGYDRQGYNREGYNRAGLDCEGYDRQGYDSAGYNRQGYDRKGYDRAGIHAEEYATSLEDFRTSYDGTIVVGDPINNEGIKRLFSSYCTALTGKPRQIIFREGGGAATDMQGKIYLDPYPLGKAAPLKENIAVVYEGLTHELGHELYTNPDHWRQVLAIASGKVPETESGITAGGQKLIAHIYNIIEDGRMERQVSAKSGAAEKLAIGCKLQPRWDEVVGEGVPVEHQLYGAMLYTSLPYFQVRDEVRAALSEPARQLFSELEPLVVRGVMGSQEDAMAATLVITRRLAEAGLTTPDESLDIRPPADPANLTANATGDGSGDGNSPGQGEQQAGAAAGQASAGSSSGEGAGAGAGAGSSGEAKSGANTQNEVAAGDKAAPATGDGSEDAESVSNELPPAQSPTTFDSSELPGAAALRDINAEFSPTHLAAALDELDSQAARAVAADVKQQARARATNIGKPLQLPLSSNPANQGKQVYLNSRGLPEQVMVRYPRLTPQTLLPYDYSQRRVEHARHARQLGAYVKNIRDQVENRLDMQSRGKLDRGRFVAAMKGQREVYTQAVELPQTSFATSIAVDLSSSMAALKSDGSLYDATMVLTDALQQLEMPCEVRGFDHTSFQFKSFGDERFEEERAATLAVAGGGFTQLQATAKLQATALAARPEKNRLQICLSDGALGDHSQTVQTLAEARKNGIQTFGIFLGEQPPTAALDELYGKGGWVAINSLKDFPRMVGLRITTLMQRLRKS